MSEAIFGLIGVVVGAVVTGGVDAMLGWRARRTAARAGARILFDEMWHAQAILESAIETKTWWGPPLELRMDNWEVHKNHLAAVMKPDDWYTLAGAFHRMSALEIVRTGLEEEEPDVEMLKGDVEWAERSLGVLLVYGNTRWQLRQLRAQFPGLPDENGSG